jgi:hypothetical protein
MLYCFSYWQYYLEVKAKTNAFEGKQCNKQAASTH